MTNSDNYNNIKKLPNGLEKLKILTYIPKPTKGDYLTGYIRNNFVIQYIFCIFGIKLTNR